MLQTGSETQGILYVFGGEKAQGAEIVIERLMAHNTAFVNTHLILSPGDFASALKVGHKPYKITTLEALKKLNRQGVGKAAYLFRAISNYFKVSANIIKYAVENNIHVVHANTIAPAAYLLPAIFYARIFRPRLKWCWSDHDMKYFSAIESGLSKICARFYDRTLVVSAAVSKKYPVSKRVLVLYNGLDTDVFKPDEPGRRLFRAAFGFTADMLVIGIVANINPDKGQLELIRAFLNLKDKHPHCRLLLAGAYAAQFPEYANQVKKLIDEAENVLHCGYVDDTVAFYNGCDILVNNSNDLRSESLGTSIYEAMACEKLVIAANTGGTREIIDDKKNGLLFTAGYVKELEQKLDEACGQYSSLCYLRKAARQKVKDRFTIDGMVNHYNHIVEGLLQLQKNNKINIG